MHRYRLSEPLNFWSRLESNFVFSAPLELNLTSCVSVIPTFCQTSSWNNLASMRRWREVRSAIRSFTATELIVGSVMPINDLD
jgi:hypothetical protein